MVVIVIRYKKISADVFWRMLLLACVPQFDTMHPSVSLGAFFNDRNLSVFDVARVRRIFSKSG